MQLDSLAFPEADAGGVGMMGMMGNTAPVPNGAPLRMMTLRTRARTGPAFRVPNPNRLPTFDASWSPRPEAKIRRVPLLFQ